MAGLVSTVEGTVNNANRTIHNAGTAAAVASNEMPRLNNNLSAGVSVMDEQASEMNQNLNTGVNVVDYQAGELNRNLGNGINLMNEQANQMNQTASYGVDMLNYQAGELNATADVAVGEIERAVTSFEGTSEVISSAIELWSPSIKIFVDLLGPMQAFAAANYFVLILKNLGLTRNVPQSIRQLDVTNTTLTDMLGAYREVESKAIVQSITKSSVVFDESTNTLKAHFFYTQNNIIVEQLRGGSNNYFAYDSILELLKGVYCWNAFANEAAQTRPKSLDPVAEAKLRQFARRHTIIYFLDPCPKTTVLSHLEFSDIHKYITIKNHFQAKEHLTIESVKIHGDCRVHFEHLIVCKIDATYGGKAHLHKCNVGWNQISVPFLFGGKPDVFHNPSNACGTVQCNECVTFYPSKSKRTNRKDPSQRFVPYPNHSKGRIFPFIGVAAAVPTNQTELCITNISDETWHVKFTGNDGSVATRLIPPCGGTVTFSMPNSCGTEDCIKPVGSGMFVFIDSRGVEYSHTYSNLTDYTIVCPTIDGFKGGVAEIQQNIKEVKVVEDDTRTILVLGRFGSGKSTFLNTLAGVYWTYIDGSFECKKVATNSKVELFRTSHSVKGCTLAALSKDVTTFDGRKVALIDTVGYDDTIHADAILNNSSLTEAVSKYKTISAVAIVVNSRDPRLTQGFLESVLCIPKSFNKRIKENIVLVFTNWNEDDEDEHGDKPNRGFTQQIQIIRSALGFHADDGPIPAFWMDNRPFKKCNSNARLTIDNLTRFLDAVAVMPQLSCHDFKEMRALSQFERSVRKGIQDYFKPSNSNMDKPSGFETFLFECAARHEKSINKFSVLGGFTAHDWSKELADALEKDINEGIPEKIQEICALVDLEIASKLPYYRFKFEKQESLGGRLAKGLMRGGAAAIVATAPASLGISLAALPLLPALAYGYSKTWKREVAKTHVVFAISKNEGEEIRQKCTDQFTSHVDDLAQRLQNMFDAASRDTREADCE